MNTRNMRQHTPSIFDKVVSAHAAAGGEGKSALGQVYSLPTDTTSETALKRAIGRDLGWLLNTISLESSVELDAYPEVQKSVLNYGLRDLSGQVDTEQRVARAVGHIRKTIAIFEPRLDRSSLSVEAARDSVGLGQSSGASAGVAVAIKAHIAPSRLFSLYYTADLDFDSGSVYVRG